MENNLISLRLSVFELNRIIVAILEHISNHKFIVNTQELFNRFDMKSYENEPDKVVRVYIIKKMVGSILENNIINKQALLNTIDISGKYEQQCTDILNNLFNEKISDKEAENIDKKISLLLKFSVVENKADKLISHINSIKSESYDDLEQEVDMVETEITSIGKDFREYNEAIETANNTVALNSSEFLGKLGRVLDKEKNPSSRIRTGLKLFNDILGGGFQNGRVYCCLAPMKNWKSGLLLNTCIWARKYNVLKAKDQTKKPIILYITLENSTHETIMRMLSYCEGNNYKAKDFTVQENMKILETNGLFSMSNDSEAGLELMYKPNKSITVADIDQIIDDYDKQGKEVVFLAVDYIKRLRPSIITKDLRIDLGGIADDLHVLAVEKDIPIVTAMQLNRSAISEIDNAETFEQKLSAFNKVGTSNVGESIDIPQNVDLTFTMIKTIDTKCSESGEIESVHKYLNFRIVASRQQLGDIDSFIHRFKDGNDMRLVEDADANVSQSIVNRQALLKDKIIKEGIKTRGASHV